MINPLQTLRRTVRLLRNPRRNDLAYLLSQVRPNAPIEERIHWLEGLLGWIRSRTLNKHEFNVETGQLQAVRIRFILHLLERHPDWKALVAATLRSILRETSALELFCQTGLSERTGFLAEAVARLQRRWLPHPPEDDDLASFFPRLFPHEDDAVWLENLSPELVVAVSDLIAFGAETDPSVFATFRDAKAEALQVLGTQVAALGLSRTFRSRLGGKPSDSPFARMNLELGRAADTFRRTGNGRAEDRAAVDRCLTELSECRECVHLTFAGLEESGVSVQLVYELEAVANALRRVETLVRMAAPGGPPRAKAALVTAFTAQLVRESNEQRGLRQLVRTNLHLMARKVAERTGESGEHYITRTAAEYKGMWLAAGGGGVVTVGTTLFKFGIQNLHPAAFFEGLLFSFNYAGSFLLMQGLGFSLATKQTSMMASNLAGRLDNTEDNRTLVRFVDEVAALSRSQLAAAAGNVGGALPLSLTVALVFRYFSGGHVIAPAYAEHFLETIHPIHSLTIPLAGFTGVLLWLASLFAGWLENWAVFHRLPEALAHHRRIVRVFGPDAAKRLGNWFLHNIAGFGGNVAAGVLLGTTSAWGRIFGATIDVRHVTLTSAAIGFALPPVWEAGVRPEMIVWAFVGLFTIAVMNLGVAFGLSLVVAFRARNLRSAGVGRLMGAIGKRLRTRPRDFFLPPRDAAPSDRDAV